MELPSYTERAEAAWVAHWLSQGMSEEDIRERFKARFPDLPGSRWLNALDRAQYGLEVTGRIANLRGRDPIILALEGEDHPANVVTVKMVFLWHDYSGKEYVNTIKQTVSWSQTLQEVMAQAHNLFEQISNRYAGADLDHAEFTGMTLYPM